MEEQNQNALLSQLMQLMSGGNGNGMNQMLSQLLGGNNQADMIERIQRLSKLMGNQQKISQQTKPQPSSKEPVLQMEEKEEPHKDEKEEALHITPLPNNLNQKHKEDNPHHKAPHHATLHTSERSRDENILYSALPFLEEPHRKIFLSLTKCMEIQRIMNRREEDFMIEAREKVVNPAQRRYQLLDAIKPHLLEEERNQLNMVMQMIQMREVFEKRGES